MAKLNIEINVTGEHDVKKLEKALKNLEASSSSVAKKNTSSASSFKSMAVKIALATAAIYTFTRAVQLATSDGFAYNNSLEQSKQGLIALSVAAQDKAIPVMDRYANATREATYTMAELQRINAETPHTLDQTNKIYKAMYISMRSVGAKTDDMINLTKKLSIAAGAAGIEFNALLAGVDGIASGTVMANSDLGRFLKGLGLTNEKLKETKDVVGLVSEALEDFEAADTMEVALSNATNSWNVFAGAITKPIFDGVKNALNEVSKMMNTYGPKAVQVFADAMVDFANGAVSSIGFVIKAVNQLIGVLQISYAGYQKLYGLAMGGDITEELKELEELKRKRKEQDYDWIGSGSSDGTLRRAIKAKEEEIEKMKEANRIRREGDELHEKAITRTNEINNLINSGIEKMHINYGKVAEKVDDISKPLESVYKKSNEPTKADKKAEAKRLKDAKKEAKKLTKAYEKEFDKLNDLFDDMGQNLGDAISSAMGPVASEIYKFYNQVQTLMAQASATSQAQSAADGAAATGPSIAKAGSQAGIYGAIAMAGLLAAFGMASGGAFDSKVSQEEIDASIGRTEFDDHSLQNLAEVFEEAQNPMLEVTNKMHKHIRNMDANFYSVARALNSKAANGGIDLTGVNFVDTFKSGFLGFSSKSISLIGTGLKFELQSLGEAMNAAELNVRSYTTTLVQKSSFFGLKNSSKIKESYKNLPPEVVADIANSFSEGYQAIMTAGISLGLDEDNLSSLLDNASVDLGKIDFTGLSPQEVSDRLSDVFSTALSGVVDSVAEFTPLIEQFAQGTEYSLETLVRIATEYDQANHLFDLIGATFQEGLMEVTRSWTETVEVESKNAFGMFGLWGDRFSLANSSFFGKLDKGFLGALGGLWSRLRGGVQTITQQMTETTMEVYTTQMQVLDVVKAAGGLQQFQDSMGVFMSEFYTESEQLEFITKSVEKSFESLGLAVPKTNDEFKALYLTLLNSGSKEGMELAGQVINLADTFSQMTDATMKLSEAGKTMVSDYSNSIYDLMTGQYSYLSIAGKQKFAEGYGQLAVQSDGLVSAVDAARSEMELAFKYATSQEEYGVYVDRLVTELKKEVPEATNDDIVERLDTLINETREYNETLKMTAGVR